MGNFWVTAQPAQNPCLGAGCCTYRPRQSGNAPTALPDDGCITGLEFYAQRVSTEGKPAVFLMGLRSMDLSNIRDAFNGTSVKWQTGWCGGVPACSTQALADGGGNNNYLSPKFTAPAVAGPPTGELVSVIPPAGYHCISAIRYYSYTNQPYSIMNLQLRWMNLADFSLSPWTEFSPGSEAYMKILQGDSKTQGYICGPTVIGDVPTDSKSAYVLQSFDVTWGPRTQDGLFGFSNARLLDIKGIVNYALTTKPTPLLKKGSGYDMFYGSPFAQIRDGYYRETLVSIYCQSGKKAGGTMPTECWCTYPSEAVSTGENKIYVDRILKDAATQKGAWQNAQATCWATDCSTDFSRVRSGGGLDATYLYRAADAVKCPDLPPQYICSVDVTVIDSKDVDVTIGALTQGCNFSQTGGLPPGCSDAKNRDTPLCKAYCDKPENKGKPQCGGTPTPIVDCTQLANLDKVECKGYCRTNKSVPACVTWCARAENKNKPDCASAIDCTQLANLDKPGCESYCKTHKGTAACTTWCARPENKTKTDCTSAIDCTDIANRNKPECQEIDCKDPANKDNPACQPAPVPFYKQTWFIIAMIVLAIVLIGWGIYAYRSSQQKEQARAGEQYQI